MSCFPAGFSSDFSISFSHLSKAPQHKRELRRLIHDQCVLKQADGKKMMPRCLHHWTATSRIVHEHEDELVILKLSMRRALSRFHLDEPASPFLLGRPVQAFVCFVEC